MKDILRQIAELANSLREEPTVLEINKAFAQLKSIDTKAAGLKPLKVAIISSFTFEMLIKPLIVRGYCNGFQFSVYNAPFGQYIQEMINPVSGLHKFDPDVVFLAVRLQDACPDLYYSYNQLNKNTINLISKKWREEWSQAIKTFRINSSALILCANYEQPPYPSLGLAESEKEPSQCGTIVRLNKWLRSLATQINNFHIMDVDTLAARCGREFWTDPKMWFWACLPIAPRFTWGYVGEIVHLLRAATGKTRKVLALDCDNTLWGGILGEVGSSGIGLGHDYPGNAYVAFQKRVLEFYNRGVVLVVASKNDLSTVMDVFENHPEMILRPNHISFFGVNWDPKPNNLQDAAKILNLGIDSFVFVDDNPVECAMVRTMLPEVMTICLPDDPAESEMTLARLDCFDQFMISDEDRRRGEMYRQEASRASLKTNSKDIKAFYHELKMVAVISRNDFSNIPRVAQLTQRTNQFNMTTIRRTESQIKDLISKPQYDIFTLRLLDRFGDNGIVGMAIVEHGDYEDILETFIMSCRVLGRTLENSFLSWIGIDSLKRGVPRLVALYESTPKNMQFRDFYKSWGMQPENDNSVENMERWYYNLAEGAAELGLPPWVEFQVTSS